MSEQRDGDGPPATVAEVDEYLAAFAADPPGERDAVMINLLLDKRAELAGADGQP